MKQQYFTSLINAAIPLFCMISSIPNGINAANLQPQTQARANSSPATQLSVNFSELLKIAEEPGACHFIPPEGWEYLDPKALPPLVKVMLRGKGSHEMPPSINLAIEETSLSQDEYINAIKELHQFDRRSSWRAIGKINTMGREVVVTQIDAKTKWGDAKMLQAILLHEGIAYVLTANAHKDEFAQFSSHFLKSIRSFTVNKTVFEMVPDDERRLRLVEACKNTSKHWQSYYDALAKDAQKASKREIALLAFENSTFQTQEWASFQQMVSRDYSDLGEQWRENLYKKVKKELLRID